jgi:hypothetical protein
MTLLHQDASARTVAYVTRLVFGLWFVKLALDPFPQLAALPASIYDPVGFLSPLPRAVTLLTLSTPFLWGLKWLALLAVGLVLLGRFRYPAALAACPLLTLQAGIALGFAGHIHHQEAVLLVAVYWLALCPVMDRLAARPSRGRGPSPDVHAGLSSVPLIGILLSLCCAYACVGVTRLVHGGLEVFTSDSMTFWALRNAYHVSQPAWGWGARVLEQPWLRVFLHAGFPVVTTFEVLAPLCLFSRWFRRLFLLVIGSFHLVSWFVLDVFFWENLLLLTLLLDGPPRFRFARTASILYTRAICR